MKNRFIVLIDFSPYSGHLLRFAYDWGYRIDAEIVLLHSTVVAAPVMAPRESKIELINIANCNALQRLKECAESVLPKGTPFEHIVSETGLVIQLRRLLQEPFNNLVFLGIKGTGLLKKIFIGSQAVNVIDSIDNLLVAVPKNAGCYPHESIHVAVQKTCPLNIIDFNKFLNFTADEISRITFFSVVTPEDDLVATESYLKDLAGLYSRKRDTSYKIYEGNSAFEDLKGIILKKKDEYIVVQRGSRTFMDQMFRKFLINELVYEGDTPLIILP